MITLGSLFDGSGGFPLAGAMVGITPVWSSEIESYPLRVTAARFPNVKQLGSVLDINGAEIEPVDIITFGSPCQDLSVAGKQKGIHAGERSNLFFEAIRIIKEMRDADKANGRSGVDIRPRFAVWENVPGAFSSNKGEDFKAVLQAFADICEDGLDVPGPPKGKWSHAGGVAGDGWSVAWRVYDAQYWGVLQRRKRIYLIADFASERAHEILFEREGLRGNPSESAAPWQGTAADVERGVGGSCRNRITTEICGGGAAGFKGNQGAKSGSTGFGIGVTPTLTAGQKCHIVYALQGNGIDRADTAGCNGCGWRTDQMYTLNTIDRPAIAATVGSFMVTNEGVSLTLMARDYKDPQIVCYDARGNGDGEVTPTLTGDHQNRVTDYTALAVGNGQLHQTDLGEKTGALNCMHDQQAVIHEGKPPRKYIVRRLTPLECCRLQGFPDWWEDGVEGSDSARYKMWGNGIALPCAVDVLRRLVRSYDQD